MPYGNKSRNVRAYEFGCLPPIEGEEKAIEVMRKRVQLWNNLVELDHKIESQKEALIAPFITVPDDEEHKDEFKKQRKAAFKIFSDQQEALLAPYITVPKDKEHREEYNKQRKVALKLGNTKTPLTELETAEYESARKIWLSSDLYWCNHEEVKISWQQAKIKPGELQFHSSYQGGKLTVRWQTGLPVNEVFGNNTLLRLDSIPDEAYTSPLRSVRRKLSRSTVSIRVASEDRKPVWLKLPCIIHRKLPSNGLVRSASVLRDKVATHWRWKLVLVIETPSEATVTPGKGTIAIDVGWRKTVTGLRSCYWSDSCGNSGELALSNEWLVGYTKTEDIESIRKNNFNSSVKSLREWIDSAKDMPDWFKESVRYLAQWKAISKLAWLTLKWRNERFTGDEDIFQKMEEWRKRDKHLYEYEANLRDRLICQRREQYRIFASGIAKKYKRVIIEDFDLRNVTKRKKKGGAADDLPEEARHQRVMATVSVLRAAIENACGKNHVEVIKIDAAGTSKQCCICGSENPDINTKKATYICPNCHKVLGVSIRLDQDYNASQNLLRGENREGE